MAKQEQKHPKCAGGSLYVDTSCIDCGTCFHIAPQIFKEDNQTEKSYNCRQPDSLYEWTQVKEAILSCPTNSIGVVSPPENFRLASVELPRLITEQIYFCGYTAEASYGATSYFIRHPEGNILVDSPRFNQHLVKKLEELGGIKYMFLTHKDDVADHQQFHDHFHCQRVIHSNDVDARTDHCEIILHSAEDLELLTDARVIMTPGHTRGHIVLLYKNKYLFTGDHLFYDHENDQIYASRGVNWYSWDEQVKSVHKLAHHDFEWILPGHGGWVHKSPEKMKDSLNAIE